jgi:uncharacterized membrane protein YtjA (UPF0391 family)
LGSRTRLGPTAFCPRGTWIATQGPDVADARAATLPPHRARRGTRKETDMLNYAIIFFIIALIAALFGFGGIAAGAAEIAKILFFIFLALFLVSLVMGFIKR